MPFLRRALLALAFGASMRAAEPGLLPPVTGELAGGLSTAWLPGAPPLQWKVVVTPGAGSERVAQFEITAEGLRARVEARLTSTALVNWRVLESEVEAERWLPVLAGKYFPGLAGLVVAGRLTATGEGEFRDGHVTGGVKFELRNATVRDAAGIWTVSGVSLAGGFRALPTLATDGALTLGFTEATAAGVAVRNGEVELSIGADNRVRVARAKAAFMDGRVEIVPFDFDLQKPEVLTDVLFEQVELNRFSTSLPSLLADARGPVSGKIAVSWSPERGLKSASGTLRPDARTPVLIALAPAPGMLTTKIPPRVGGFMPSWLGWMFPAKTPAYDTLREIERGDTRLEVTAIQVMVQPEGDPNDRTAQIIIESAPAKHRADVKSVRFEINVTGPLADFVKLLLEGNVKLHLR